MYNIRDDRENRYRARYRGIDPIYDVNHQEDKEASRRIEIKFTLKNEEAIKEIENILH